MSSSFVRLYIAFALLVAVAPAPALAADAPAPAATDDGLAAAKAHFDAGRQAYTANDFQTAVREFQAAQAIRPSPLLDYNMGLCYEALGDAQNAADAFQRYLDQAPDAQNRAEVEQRIAAARAFLAGGASPADPNARPTPPARPPVAAGGTPANPGSGDPYTRTYAPPPAGAPAAPVASKPSRWWIVPVVIGAVALTATIVVVAAVASGAGQTYVYEAPPRAIETTTLSPATPALLRF